MRVARRGQMSFRVGHGRQLFLRARQLFLRAGELHREQRTLNLEWRGALQATSQAHPLQRGNDPLRRIELPPTHAIAVVVREDVVKVVIALAVSDEREERIVTRGVRVGVRPRAPHVSQRVDEEGDVMADHQAQDAREDERAPHIADRPTCQQGEADVGHQHQRHIEAMLELEQRVAAQIGNVGEVRLAAGILAQHPADVRKPETAFDGIRIEVDVVDVQMMRAMAAAPDERAVLQRHRAEDHEEQPQRPVRVVGLVRPQSVVAAGDRQSVRDQKERIPAPGAQRKAVSQSVPGDEDDGGQHRNRKQQGRRPQAPSPGECPGGGRLGGDSGLSQIRHEVPVGSQWRA